MISVSGQRIAPPDHTPLRPWRFSHDHTQGNRISRGIADHPGSRPAKPLEIHRPGRRSPGRGIPACVSRISAVRHGLGQDLSEKRQSRSPQGHVHQSLRHHSGGRPLYSQGRRAVSRASTQRSVRRGQGTVLRPLCPDDGRARFRHAGLRPVLYGGKRRRTAQCRLSGHQHRGFQRGGGLSRPAPIG